MNQSAKCTSRKPIGKAAQVLPEFREKVFAKFGEKVDFVCSPKLVGKAWWICCAVVGRQTAIMLRVWACTFLLLLSCHFDNAAVTSHSMANLG